MVERSLFLEGAVHVFKMDYTVKEWRSFAEGNTACRLQVTKRNREYFVKITPERDSMKVIT